MSAYSFKSKRDRSAETMCALVNANWFVSNITFIKHFSLVNPIDSSLSQQETQDSTTGMSNLYKFVNLCDKVSNYH